MKTLPKKSNSWLALIAAVASRLFGKSVKPTADDLKKVDFRTSTQRMGIRFTDKIRNVFRSRWLKKS